MNECCHPRTEIAILELCFVFKFTNIFTLKNNYSREKDESTEVITISGQQYSLTLSLNMQTVSISQHCSCDLEFPMPIYTFTFCHFPVYTNFSFLIINVSCLKLLTLIYLHINQKFSNIPWGSSQTPSYRTRPIADHIRIHFICKQIQY